MIVCVCNAINTASTDEAIQQGCKTPNDIHKYHQVQPCCCKCFKQMKDCIKQHQQSMKSEH